MLDDGVPPLVQKLQPPPGRLGRIMLADQQDYAFRAGRCVEERSRHMLPPLLVARLDDDHRMPFRTKPLPQRVSHIRPRHLHGNEHETAR
jgi:hypothetical protein